MPVGWLAGRPWSGGRGLVEQLARRPLDEPGNPANLFLGQLPVAVVDGIANAGEMAGSRAAPGLSPPTKQVSNQSTC